MYFCNVHATSRFQQSYGYQPWALTTKPPPHRVLAIRDEFHYASYNEHSIKSVPAAHVMWHTLFEVISFSPEQLLQKTKTSTSASTESQRAREREREMYANVRRCSHLKGNGLEWVPGGSAAQSSTLKNVFHFIQMVRSHEYGGLRGFAAVSGRAASHGGDEVFGVRKQHETLTITDCTSKRNFVRFTGVKGHKCILRVERF